MRKIFIYFLALFFCSVSVNESIQAKEADGHDHSANRLRCEEHDTWEDECYICHPELKPKSAEEAKTNQKVDSSVTHDSNSPYCREHNVYEDECGICHPELADTLAYGQSLKVRLSSKKSASKAGIETVRPYVSKLAEGIHCYAEFEFNQNKLAQITSTVDGFLQKAEIDLGGQVKKGQLLATVWSAAIGKSVARAKLAYQDVLRERKLREGQISSEKDFQEAETSYRVASQQLKAQGFSDSKIEELMTQPLETAVLEINAPFAGEIVKRNAVQGAMVKAGTSLFTLTDRTIMWAMINIPEKYIPRIQLGQKVELTIDALPAQNFTGNLTWISSEIDPRTRMAEARAEVKDSSGLLKAHMFARARILLSDHQESVVVPLSAIQQINHRPFVFVRLNEDLYEIRAIEIGIKDASEVEIVKGLKADEAVVTTGSFVLKSQFLISRLGAGCTE